MIHHAARRRLHGRTVLLAKENRHQTPRPFITTKPARVTPQISLRRLASTISRHFKPQHGIGISRVQAQRLGEISRCANEITVEVARPPAVHPGTVIRRVEPQGLVEILDGQVVVAACIVDQAAIAERDGELRIEPQRLVVIAQRLVMRASVVVAALPRPLNASAKAGLSRMAAV